MKAMKVLVATRNKGKLAEYRAMLGGLGLEAISLDEAGVDPAGDVAEDGETFEQNAHIKAIALQEAFPVGWTLADDSGLSVDALGGRPGVYSARFAGVEGKGPWVDRANLDRLLAELEGTPEERRSARFVCAIEMRGPAGEVLTARGACEGRILCAPRGTGGFGYDPVFLPVGGDQTMAELPMEQKNHISHRGKALAALMQKLAQLLQR